jgi:hypothetical protein
VTYSTTKTIVTASSRPTSSDPHSAATVGSLSRIATITASSTKPMMSLFSHDSPLAVRRSGSSLS